MKERSNCCDTAAASVNSNKCFPCTAAAITSTVVPRQQLPPPQLQDQDLAKTERTKAALMNHTKTTPRPETSTNAKTNRLKQCLIGRHGQRWLVCIHDATEFRIFIATFNCWGVFTVSTCLFFNSVIGEYGPGAILGFFPFCRPLEMHHSAAFFNDNPHG